LLKLVTMETGNQVTGLSEVAWMFAPLVRGALKRTTWGDR